MSDLVGTPEDRFSHNEAQMKATVEADPSIKLSLAASLKAPYLTSVVETH